MKPDELSKGDVIGYRKGLLWIKEQEARRALVTPVVQRSASYTAVGFDFYISHDALRRNHFWYIEVRATEPAAYRAEDPSEPTGVFTLTSKNRNAGQDCPGGCGERLYEGDAVTTFAGKVMHKQCADRLAADSAS